MREEHGYWVVKFRAYAFDTKADALAFQDKLLDAFCAMPEGEGYGASAWVARESDETDWLGNPTRAAAGSGDRGEG